jgi:hypothetical protein
MQFNFLFIVALCIASDNGIHISTTLWVIVWALTIARGTILAEEVIKKNKGKK